MKATLNIASLVLLGALGAGIYFTAPDEGAAPSGPAMPDPEPHVDSVPADPLAADETAGGVTDSTTDGAAFVDAIRYTVEGTQPGYFIANQEIRFGDMALENVELWPAIPECDEPAYVRLAMEDTSDQLGENEYGPYYRLYAMRIDSAAITDDGVMITASDADIGTLVIEADYVSGALAEWQAGADAIGELLVGTATLNGETQPASFAFWIGD